MSQERVEAEAEAAPAQAEGVSAAPAFGGVLLAPTAASVLALQRSAGNAAVGRWLSRTPPPGAPAAPPKPAGGGAAAPAGTGLPPGAQWAVPTQVDKSKLLGQAMAITGDIAYGEDPGEDGKRRQAMLKQASYLVVTDKLYHYDHHGMPMPTPSYELKPNAKTPPPGYYLTTREDQKWRRMFLTPWDEFSPAHFGPYTSTENYNMDQWLAGGAEAAAKLGDAWSKNQAVVMAVSPLAAGRGKAGPPPKWASKLAKDALGILGKTPKAPPGQKPPMDQVDELIPYKKGDKVFVQVGADGAKKSIPVREGQSPDELAKQAKDEAKKMREDRDPEKSRGKIGGVGETGVTEDAKTATVGGFSLRTKEERELVPPGMHNTANAPAYPAAMVMAGASPADPESHKTVIGATNRFQMTVIGATNRFQMTLQFGFGGYNSINLITNQMQPIQYYWEIIDVSDVKAKAPPAEQKVGDVADAELKAAKGTAAGQKPNAVGNSGEVNDIARKWEDYKEDTRADLAAMDKVPWPLRMQYLEVIALSGIVRTAGSLVDAFVTRLSTPLNEKTIGFDKEGDFVIRCIATPQAAPDAPVRRASSIAAKVVRVTTVKHRAEEADREEDDRIAADQKRISDPNASILEVEDAKDDLAEAQYLKSHGHEDNTLFLLRRFEKKLELARQLKRDDAAHVPTRKRSTDVRKFALKLGRTYDIDQVILGLEHTCKEMQAMLSRIVGYGEKGAADARLRMSPKMTLASEENGQLYRLMTVLVQTKTLETDKVVEYRLADVTSKNSQQEYLGQSKLEGREGHLAAIEAAFNNFRENNEYGRGTLRLRVSGKLPGDLGEITFEKETRSTKGEKARALQKLKDIATAAEIAGMIVGGPAGVAIGLAGAATGLALAADSLHKKSTGDRLEFDFETVMDVVGVLGSLVGAAGGVTGALSQIAKGGSRTARVLSATGGFVHVLGKGQLAGQVIAVPYGYLHALDKIDQETKGLPDDQKPLPGELALRRAEAFQQFAWGCFTTTVSALQMAGMDPLVGGEKLTGKTARDNAGGQMPKEVGVKEAGSGGARKPPAPPAHPHAAAAAPAPGNAKAGPKEVPHKLVHPNEVSMMVDKAIGKRGDPLRLQRIQVVPTDVLNSVHQDLHGTNMPDGAVGIFDPNTNTLYMGAEHYTPQRHAQVLKSVENRITAAAKKKFGSEFADGFRSMSQRMAVENAPHATPRGSKPGELLVARLSEFIPLETLTAAMTDNDFGPVREKLVERYGNARANAIEQAMGQNRSFDALTMLDLPKGEVGKAFGSFMSEGIADFITSERGGKAVNAERAKLVGEIANKVGLDVLREALLDGNVGRLETALENALGPQRAGVLKEALLGGDHKAIRKALNEPKPPARPTGKKAPAPEPPTPKPKASEAGAAKPAAHGAKPAGLPDKPAVVAARDALAAALVDNPHAPAKALTEPAAGLIKEAGSFKALREAVENGAFGETDAAKARAKEALQSARVEVTNKVLEKVLKELREKYPDLDIQLSDLGTPGFGSDRDITIKAKEKAGVKANPNDLVAASVEGVQKAYDALNEAGLPPDASLDSNFYTELHEGAVKPRDAAERAAISKGQDVVSLTELRMNMKDEKQWKAFKEEQLGRFENYDGVAGEIDARARQALKEQFAAAEAKAKELTSQPREQALKAKRDELLKALAQKDPPATPEQLRNLMGDVKLLEPDAYGTRAAVEGVVDFQQALARATDSAGYGPILKNRPGRLGQRGTPTSEEYATLSQEATSSLGKLLHAHNGPASKPSQAAAVSKYLSRIMQAAMEAGIRVSSSLADKAGQVVAAKATSPEAVMREIRAWGDARGLGDVPTEVLMGEYIKACEKLGLDLASDLRVRKESTAAQESWMGTGPADKPISASPSPPPRAPAGAAPPAGGGGPPSGGGGPPSRVPPSSNGGPPSSAPASRPGAGTHDAGPPSSGAPTRREGAGVVSDANGPPTVREPRREPAPTDDNGPATVREPRVAPVNDEGPATKRQPERVNAEGLLDQSTPERYLVSDPDMREAHCEAHLEDPPGASVGGKELSLTLRTEIEEGPEGNKTTRRSTKLRGGDQFAKIVAYFAGKFTAIRGAWSYGTNLGKFNEALAANPQMTHQQAALETWTGGKAKELGFTEVEIRNLEPRDSTRGPYTKVDVVFRKPKGKP